MVSMAPIAQMTSKYSLYQRQIAAAAMTGASKSQSCQRGTGTADQPITGAAR